ncbi:ABC-type transport auxiliary lipoprotein family protein [Sphingopyxis sp. SE2]|jgi:cholesterol transport system auxiliary component|uniref:ABC-type transport auxiliary lipoprotein family protein n=1 Tax=unclassified Sphingopyxis TaxID=2614943 RepID=UPI00050D9909|nr:MULTISPECIES: ABC-type transport auxiliary lipoprotein family protein [unclassified Sphingopyxis]KGB57502.1 ABC transporter [Sphingopyxis sp. LC363]MDT7528937.1 ABC-type transport auxiliary lipoprotein family protein [Sphingopyxis sp. SE2]
MMRRFRAPLIAAVAAATLSGCIGLGGKTPPFLLTLDPEAEPQAGAARTAAEAATLTILIPTAPQKLRTTRIPVQQDDASVTYVKDAQWVEAPSRLFQRLVSETVAARTSRVVLDEGQYLTAPGEQLAGQLMEFGVDARSNEVVVAYQAMLVAAGGKTVTQRRFEAREPISGKVEAKAVGEALTRAANKVAVDVAGWLGG